MVANSVPAFYVHLLPYFTIFSSLTNTIPTQQQDNTYKYCKMTLKSLKTQNKASFSAISRSSKTASTVAISTFIAPIPGSNSKLVLFFTISHYGKKSPKI